LPSSARRTGATQARPAQRTLYVGHGAVGEPAPLATASSRESPRPCPTATNRSPGNDSPRNRPCTPVNVISDPRAPPSRPRPLEQRGSRSAITRVALSAPPERRRATSRSSKGSLLPAISLPLPRDPLPAIITTSAPLVPDSSGPLDRTSPIEARCRARDLRPLLTRDRGGNPRCRGLSDVTSGATIGEARETTRPISGAAWNGPGSPPRRPEDAGFNAARGRAPRRRPQGLSRSRPPPACSVRSRRGR